MLLFFSSLYIHVLFTFLLFIFLVLITDILPLVYVTFSVTLFLAPLSFMRTFVPSLPPTLSLITLTSPHSWSSTGRVRTCVALVKNIPIFWCCYSGNFSNLILTWKLINCSAINLCSSRKFIGGQISLIK